MGKRACLCGAVFSNSQELIRVFLFFSLVLVVGLFLHRMVFPPIALFCFFSGIRSCRSSTRTSCFAMIVIDCCFVAMPPYFRGGINLRVCLLCQKDHRAEGRQVTQEE